MAETIEKMTEEQSKERGEYNDEYKIVEDTSGFKKDEVVETDGNLPLDDNSDTTVLNVEKDTPDEATDVSTEEIVEHSMKKEDIDTIDAEAKAYFDKQVKEAEIDWDKVEFEDEEKMFPKVSKEELDVFCAISEGFIDRETVETYLNIAHADIENYIEMKAIVESGQASEEDRDYYDSLSKSKENSRILLASIQQDGRKLDKEFKESHIAEDLIKAVTLKAMSDYIVKKYRLSNSWRPSSDERHNIDNTEIIRKDLLKNMYVAPLFKNIIERDTIKAESNRKFNMFGPVFYNNHLDDFTSAVRTYISHGKLDFDKLTIEKVLSSDFKSFEFMRIPMVWAIKNFNESIKSIKDWEMTQEDEDKLRPRMSPNGVNDEELKELANSIDAGINTLMNVQVLDNEISLAMEIIKDDPFTNKLALTNEADWCDSEKVMILIADHIPEIVSKDNFSEWSKIFKYLQKYERYYLFYKLRECIISEENDEDKKRVSSFNVLCGLVEDYYTFMVGELITCLNAFIRENGYDREGQNIMFSSMMSNFICQHELGYRQKLIVDGEEKNVSGDGLYNLAKDLLKDKYEYIVGTKEDDILLRDVDLVETRKMYIKDCTNMVNFITSQLKMVGDDVEGIRNDCATDAMLFKSSKKKSKKKRR